MRRAIVILPGAFTSGNLFFGIWSIVLASRGQYVQASWFIVLAGLMDVLDGRVARMSRTGTAFGAELDSLVDAISFGVAPALLVFFHTFSRGGEWAWLLCFLYVLAVVLRLARFNVEQAGHAKSQFFGLPSPAAGMTLATFYPFSQTAWFQANLAEAFPTARALALLVVVVSLLMVSHVPYPTWPRVDLRSVKGVLGAAHLLGIIAAAVYIADYFFFPYGLLYLGFGLGRAVFLGFLDRLPDRDPLRDEEDDGRRPVDDQLHPRHLPFRIGRPRRSGGGSA
jgi:CDP-diacylglycerol--serine O-phosphatidyltransferase